MVKEPLLQRDGVRTGRGLELTTTFGKSNKDVTDNADMLTVPGRQRTPQLLSPGKRAG